MRKQIQNFALIKKYWHITIASQEKRAKGLSLLFSFLYVGTVIFDGVDN